MFIMWGKESEPTKQLEIEPIVGKSGGGGGALRILLCTLAKKPAHCITLTPWTTADTVGIVTLFKKPNPRN